MRGIGLEEQLGGNVDKIRIQIKIGRLRDLKYEEQKSSSKEEFKDNSDRGITTHWFNAKYGKYTLI